MLGKLFKYDCIQLGRQVGPIALGFPVFGLLTFAFWLWAMEAGGNLAQVASVLTVWIPFAGFVALFVTFIVSSLIQFQKSLLLKESYFTHTIPARMEQILLAKLLAVLFWFLIAVISAVVALAPLFTENIDLLASIHLIFSVDVLRSLPKLFVIFLVFPTALITFVGMAISMTGLPAVAGKNVGRLVVLLIMFGVVPWLLSSLISTILGPESRIIYLEQGGLSITLDYLFGSGLYVSGLLFFLLSVICFFVTAFVLKHHRAVTAE